MMLQEKFSFSTFSLKNKRARLVEVAAARTGVAADSAAQLADNQNLSAAMAAMLGAPSACKSLCCAPAR